MFDEFLNIASCDDIPDVSMWREEFESEFRLMIAEYTKAQGMTNSALGVNPVK